MRKVSLTPTKATKRITGALTMKQFALLSDQGTACYEACLCAACHADPANREKIENIARKIADIPNPTDWQDCTGNDALECVVCGAISHGFRNFYRCPSCGHEWEDVA